MLLYIFLFCVLVILIIILFKYLRIYSRWGLLLGRKSSKRIIDKPIIDKYKNMNAKEVMKEAQQKLRCGHFSKAEILFRLAKKKEAKKD